jgi:DNA polymerase (family 10)
LQIKGLGPKKVAVIWHELGIESVGELEYACNENRLVAYKGFGAKTQDSILQNIAFMKQMEGQCLFAAGSIFAQSLVDDLSKKMPNARFQTTGALRRQEDVLAVIELITDASVDVLVPFLQVYEGLDSLDVQGHMVSFQLPLLPPVQIHLSAVADFFTTLFTTTATPQFLQACSAIGPILAQADSEQAIFVNLGKAYLEPALRCTDVFLTNDAGNQPPVLIQSSDIKGIIHSHSKWSDGSNTLLDMASAAKAQGFEYLVISDHSKSAFYASGLQEDRIIAQHKEIDQINKQLAPFKIFKSIESDILNDGSLDYAPGILQSFDLIIASVHSNLKMQEEKAMQRLITAIENPYTNILGHMTGRLLLSRKGYPVDHQKIIDACAANNVVIELNAHPRRLDIDWRMIGKALDKGLLISINPDAHAIDGFDDCRYGVLVAQKAGVTKENNLSSYNLDAFERWVATQQSKRK